MRTEKLLDLRSNSEESEFRTLPFSVTWQRSFNCSLNSRQSQAVSFLSGGFVLLKGNQNFSAVSSKASSRYSTMKPHFVLEATFLLIFLSLCTADLNSDKQALLDFAGAVPHGRKLNWNANTSICSSWVGISCTLHGGTRVFALRLPGFGLYGPIPANTLGKLDSLIILSLHANKLSGDLPSDLLSLPSLHYMYLQHNNFSGHIPSHYPHQLILLDLSFNFLTGRIPAAIQNLTRLFGLHLNHNSLTGSIPNLNLTRLRYLNLSYNSLTGSIPPTLRKFPASSFIGNSLCGSPLQPCYSITPAPSPSPTITAPKKPRKGSATELSTNAVWGIAVGGSSVLILLIVGILTYCWYANKNGDSSPMSTGEGERSSKKPKKSIGSKAREGKLTFFGGSSYNFNLEDLLVASSLVLGKGSHGIAYRVELEDGTFVFVKRLSNVVARKEEFEQHMDNVGRVRQHPNVVPLRAYYYSGDDKILVYDYLAAGSLHNLLHGPGREPADWATRVRISLGAARGIAYIHTAADGEFIHGNIKSSNVLLTDDYQGCVSDIGITHVTNFPAKPSRSVGYRAPEVTQTRRTSQKSDVYSFGVLLLEMITGKEPVQSILGNNAGAVDLPRWARTCIHEEWTSEVFDVELLRHGNIEGELIQMLQIALECVEEAPEKRPEMREVVRMIEEMKPARAYDAPPAA